MIGAGVAGLACASELARADVTVTVLERARGLGGRLATRRRGNLAFDHGAQFITARSRPFVRYVTVAQNAGAAAAWTPSILEDGHRNWDSPIEEWYVGAPGMSGIVRPLARGLTLETGTFVHELLRRDNGWELETDTGRRLAPFNAVVAAVPAPQALSLLAPHGRAFRHLISVQMAPCWALMAHFERRVSHRERRLSLDAGSPSRWPRGRAASPAGRRIAAAGSSMRRLAGVATTSKPTHRRPRSSCCTPLQLPSATVCRHPPGCTRIAGDTRWWNSRLGCPACSTPISPPAPAETGASHRAWRRHSKAAVRWRTPCSRHWAGWRRPPRPTLVLNPLSCPAVNAPCCRAVQAPARRRAAAAYPNRLSRSRIDVGTKKGAPHIRLGARHRRWRYRGIVEAAFAQSARDVHPRTPRPRRGWMTRPRPRAGSRRHRRSGEPAFGPGRLVGREHAQSGHR